MTIRHLHNTQALILSMFRQNETLKNLSHQAKAYFYCYRQNSPVSLLDITDSISRNNDKKKFIARVATLVRRVGFAKHILNEKVSNAKEICNLSKPGLTKTSVLNKYINTQTTLQHEDFQSFQAYQVCKSGFVSAPVDNTSLLNRNDIPCVSGDCFS